MVVFYFIVFVLYFILLIVLLAGWPKVASPQDVKSSKITVVVPFRNEEKVIDHLMKSLGVLDYPQNEFEVILVDDHSIDRSAEIVGHQLSSYPNFKLLSLPEGRFGKKQAITYAIENAAGDVIVSTDADCQFPRQWLRCINECFGDGKLKMVLGGVKVADDAGAFSKLQAMEFTSLVGVSATTVSLGVPTLCNGANLAFLKSAFVEVKGYEGNLSIASGDDEFLMRKIRDRFPGSIYFLPSPDSVVTTRPQETIAAFVQQRLRWAGKWKHNSSSISKWLAVFIVLFHLSFVGLIILTAIKMIALPWSLLFFAMKIIPEYFFLQKASKFLGVKWRGLYFFILQFLHPVYVVFIGVGSFFMTPKWKGREVQSSKVSV